MLLFIITIIVFTLLLILNLQLANEKKKKKKCYSKTLHKTATPYTSVLTKVKITHKDPLEACLSYSQVLVHALSFEFTSR